MLAIHWINHYSPIGSPNTYMGLVPKRPISVNPGLKMLFLFLYLPPYALLGVTISVFITVSQSTDSTVF